MVVALSALVQEIISAIITRLKSWVHAPVRPRRRCLSRLTSN